MSAPAIAPKLGRRLTMPEAADYLGISYNALAAHVRRGEIACHRVTPRGRHYFYPAELDQWLDATRVQQAATRRPLMPEVQAPARRSIAHLLPSVRKFS